MNKLHFFIDESGVLKVITDMPEEPNHLNYKYRNDLKEWLWKTQSHKNQYSYDYDQYQSALKAAKEKALQVVNKDDVFLRIYFKEHGQIYPLKGCSIKVQEACASDCCELMGLCDNCREPKKLALITFSESKPMNEEKAPGFQKPDFDKIARIKFDTENSRPDDGNEMRAYRQGLEDGWKECTPQLKSIPPLPVEDKEEIYNELAAYAYECIQWQDGDPAGFDILKLEKKLREFDIARKQL